MQGANERSWDVQGARYEQKGLECARCKLRMWEAGMCMRANARSWNVQGARCELERLGCACTQQAASSSFNCVRCKVRTQGAGICKVRMREARLCMQMAVASAALGAMCKRERLECARCKRCERVRLECACRWQAELGCMDGLFGSGANAIATERVD
eukprot:scaffold141902_cov19-Tisochrysis_lutea.AAC.2